MKQVILQLIRFYQRFLSKKKGYSCAYRVVHGGASCSQYGKHSIQHDGVIKGSQLLFKRFAACGQAYRIAKDKKDEKTNKKPKKEKDSTLSDCLILEGVGELSCCALSGIFG